MLAALDLSLDPSDVPPDVMDALKKMDALKESQTSVALSLTEIMVISQALGMLQKAVKDGVKHHGDDMPEVVLDMFADARALERRFDALTKSVFERELDFDHDEMLAKVTDLASKAREKHGRDHDHPHVNAYTGGQYL